MISIYLRSSRSDNYKDRSPGLHKRTLPLLGPYFSFIGTSPKLQRMSSSFSATSQTVTSSPLLPNHKLNSFSSPMLTLPLQFLDPYRNFLTLHWILQHLLPHPPRLLSLFIFIWLFILSSSFHSSLFSIHQLLVLRQSSFLQSFLLHYSWSLIPDACFLIPAAWFLNSDSWFLVYYSFVLLHSTSFDAVFNITVRYTRKDAKH